MALSSNIAIKTTNLSRSYQTYKKSEGLLASVKGLWNREYTEKIALNQVSLEIPEGQIVGLVGANGAGKTTLLKLLSGLISPTGGSAEVLGYQPSQRKKDFLKKISILLGQKNQLWWDIAPLDSYNLLTQIYDLDAKATKTKIYALAEMLHCKDQLETQLRRLSLGERMKMEIIGSLLHDPKILFLDEPTIGLDILAQSAIREFLATYVKEKKPTVILTSHYMDDISKLADRLLLISKGSIFYDGTVENFVKKSGQKKQLCVIYEQPLNQNIQLRQDLILTANSREHHLNVEQQDLSWVLPKLTQAGAIQDLKFEEINFEDTIKDFLIQQT